MMVQNPKCLFYRWSKVREYNFNKWLYHRFYQQDPTNYNHPLVLAPQDGTYGGGTQLADVKYFRSINNNSFNVDDSSNLECIIQNSNTNIVGMFNEKQNYLEFHNDNTNTTLYFYCAPTYCMYGTSTITVNPVVAVNGLILG